MPGLQRVAAQLLAQRGIQPTPENISRALAAFEANPELAMRFIQQTQGLERTGSQETGSERPAPAAFADPFDQAFAKAVNGGQVPVAGQPAPPTSAPTVPDAAPPIIPVTQTPSPSQGATGGIPDAIAAQVASTLPGQGSPLAPGFDVAAQESAARESPDDWPWPIVLPGPAGKPSGTAVVPVDAPSGAQVSAPAARVGAQRALDAPSKQLTGPSNAISAPSPQLTGPSTPTSAVETAPIDNPVREKAVKAPQVEGDIGKIIDKQDAPIKQITETRIEFDMGPDHVVMDSKGKGSVAVSSPDGALVQVRDPAILERIRRFLQRYGAEFRSFARLL